MIKKCFTATKDTLQRHKKKLGGLVAVVALVAVLSLGAHAMFRVQGVVTSVDNNNVTVANFLGSRSVDVTGAPVNIAGIKPGDRIMIQKNLQGNVLYVTSFAPRGKADFAPRHGDVPKRGDHNYEGGRR